MDRGAVVHVIVQARGGLLRALTRALQGLVQVRHWRAMPNAERVAATDVLVVDLADLPEGVTAADLAPMLERATCWLVPGAKPVETSWLAMSGQPAVRVAPCDTAARAKGFEPVVGALHEQFTRQTGRLLAKLVLEHEPVFRPAEQLVELVCHHPWRVRRPKDLALLTGQRLSRLKAVLAELGFHRVEHFIVCVRMVAFEQLMSRERLPLSVARRLVGIGDPTNARRQLRRARKSSGEAFLKLKSLVA
jgi:hypothetical protein